MRGKEGEMGKERRGGGAREGVWSGDKPFTSMLSSSNFSDKIGTKTQTVMRDREGHYIVINWSTQQGNVTFYKLRQLPKEHLII